MNSSIERSEPLADQVYAYLRREILKGQIEPGSRLVETKIAKQLAISRSPVREAIRRLEQEGLVVNNQGVMTLFKPSISDFEDLYELRLAIEPMAARLAATRMSPQECTEMEVVLKKSEFCLEKADLDPFIDYNTYFHNLIVKGSGNRRLQKVAHDTAALCRYYRNIAFKIYHRRVTSVEEHWQIYLAICERNTKAAGEHMVDHLERDLTFIQSACQHEGDWQYETT